jgi:hypothetical protein
LRVPLTIASLWAALAASSAWAQAPTLELKLDRTEVAVGERVQVELTVTASSNLPVTGVEMAGLQEFLVESGPDVAMSLRVDLRRGVSLSVASHRYTIVPRRPGSFVIGPATAIVAGKSHQSNSVRLRVTQEPQVRLQATDPQLFVQASVDRSEVFVGEQVTVSFHLYSRVNYFGLELGREPTTEGFWSEEIEVPRGYQAYSQAVLDGIPYRVQILRRQALFPLRSGKLTVGPMVLDVQVGMGFFGGGRKMTRASRPVTIEVKPLPIQGRPPGFHEANVGRFTLSGGVDRHQTTLGEAVKYRVLEGTGNIKNVVLPELPQGPGYRRFDPQPQISMRVENDRVTGSRVLEYLLSPSAPGHFTIPALVFHYFDPELSSFRTISLPEATVTVQGAPGGAVAATTGSGPAPGADPDLRGIHDPGEIADAGLPFHREAWFWALVAAPILVFGLLLLGERLAAFRSRLRLKGEPRRRAAQAWRRLREAERFLKAGDAIAFFGEISRVLTTFLELKLGQPVGSLTLSELRALLEERGFPEQVTAAILSEVENCDFARFAPREARVEEMRKALSRVRKLLDGLDRIRPAPPRSETATAEAR